MTKQITALLSLLLCTFLLFVLAHMFSPAQEPTYIIGILSSAQHPALEQALEGFKQKIINKLNKNVSFIEYIGKDHDHINNCARLLSVNEQINTFFSLGSPATQALTSLERKRPIIFAAVSDSSIHTLHKHNVCGLSDKTNKKNSIKLIKKLVPSAQKIGVLYTPDETQTQEYLNELTNTLKNEHMKPYLINIREQDPQKKYKNLDALFIIEDNTIAASMKDLASQALQNKKPLFAGYTQAVIEGALAAHGINYQKSGYLAGKYTLKILKKRTVPQNVGIITAPDDNILINTELSKKLKIHVPSELSQYEISNTL